MLVGDKIKVQMVTEMAGVAMTNLLYFDVADATLGSTLEAALLEIAQSFNTAMGSTRSSTAVLTCATWDNLEGNDPFTQAFFNEPGSGLATALPTQSAVRVARYAEDLGALKVGGVSLAGIVETLVLRGRLAAAGEFGTVEAWLVDPLILAAGPTLNPGFFIDTVAPATPKWVDTIKARTRSRIVSQSKRQSKLCGS